jgi:hypothetical protein
VIELKSNDQETGSNSDWFIWAFDWLNPTHGQKMDIVPDRAN